MCWELGDLTTRPLDHSTISSVFNYSLWGMDYKGLVGGMWVEKAELRGWAIGSGGWEGFLLAGNGGELGFRGHGVCWKGCGTEGLGIHFVLIKLASTCYHSSLIGISCFGSHHILQSLSLSFSASCRHVVMLVDAVSSLLVLILISTTAHYSSPLPTPVVHVLINTHL